MKEYFSIFLFTKFRYINYYFISSIKIFRFHNEFWCYIALDFDLLV